MKRSIALLLLIALTGCYQTKRCLQKPLKTASLSQLPCAVDTPVFVRAEWPQNCWWRQFHDPQLNELIESGLNKSPDVMAARYRAQAALQVAKAQKSILFPQLTFTVNDLWIAQSKNGPFLGLIPIPSIPQTYNDTKLALNLNYDLDYLHKNENIALAAFDQALAKRLDVEETRRILSASIASAYFQLQASKESLAVHKHIQHELETILQLTQQCLVQGLCTMLDVDRAESASLNERETIEALEKLIELEEHMIRVLVGEGPCSSKPIKACWHYKDLAPSVPKDIRLRLLGKRPDLSALVWLIRSETCSVAAAKAQFFPDINLSALAGLESIHFNNLFSLGSKTGQFNPVLTLPVFNAGMLQAQLDESVAHLEEAVALYNSKLLKAVQEIADSVSQITWQHKQLQSERRLMERKEHDLVLYQEQLKSGLGTEIIVSQARIAVFEQQLHEIDVQNQQLNSYIQLTKALGGSFCQ